MVTMKDHDGIPLKWKKLQVLSISVAALLIPIVLALVGHLVNSTLKEKELRLQYVELAVGILKEEPTQETSNLREWAIEVIELNSPVKLPQEAIEELKNKSLWSAVTSEGLSRLSYSLVKVADSDTDRIIYISSAGLRPLKLLRVDVIGGKTITKDTSESKHIDWASKEERISTKFTITVRKDHPSSPAIVILKTDQGLMDIEIP